MSKLLYYVAFVVVTVVALPNVTNAQSRCGMEPDSKIQSLLAEVYRPPPDPDGAQFERNWMSYSD